MRRGAKRAAGQALEQKVCEVAIDGTGGCRVAPGSVAGHQESHHLLTSAGCSEEDP